MLLFNVKITHNECQQFKIVYKNKNKDTPCIQMVKLNYNKMSN